MEVNPRELKGDHRVLMLSLLRGGVEMLHLTERGKCAVCGKPRTRYEYDDECPLLLRHALIYASEAAQHFAHCRQCGEVSASACDDGGREYAINLGLYSPSF